MPDLHHAILEVAKANADSVAFQSSLKEWTYFDFGQAVRKAATGLLMSGISQGDKVATLNRDHVEVLIIVVAAMSIGAVCVPLNPRLNDAELQEQIIESQIKLIVSDVDIRTMARKQDKFQSVNCQEFFESLSKFESLSNQNMHKGSSEEIALQLYSSGTTGKSKGVLLSHGNLLENLAVFGAYSSFHKSSTVLNALPNCHVAGISLALNAALVGGKSLFLSKFDAADVLKKIAASQVTHLYLVPTMLKMLVDEAKETNVDVSSLQRIVYGGAAISKSLLQEAREKFQCGFVQTYGMTETTAGVCFLMPEDHDGPLEQNERIYSAGRPLFGAKVKIIKPNTEDEMPEGEVGEIWIWSRKNMRGYLGSTHESQQMTKWIHSTDLGYLRDGYLYWAGRSTEVINTGGEKVYAVEVEQALLKHEYVSDVAVVGVPDDKWGECVKAFIVLREGKMASEKEIISFSRTRLSNFKSPKNVTFLSALPKTVSGKINKQALKRWPDFANNSG